MLQKAYINGLKIGWMPHPPLSLPLEGGEAEFSLSFKGRVGVGMGFQRLCIAGMFKLL